MEKKITFLGTGHATVTNYYNTCFLIETPQDKLLIDAGGGNGILTKLKEAKTAIGDIHHMFVTHTHMDHILGTAWILRMVAQNTMKGAYEGQMTVYGHDEVISAIQTMAELFLSKKHKKIVDERVVYHTLKDREEVQLEDFRFIAIDANSEKCKQFGLLMNFADGKRWFYPGDEPYREVGSIEPEKVCGVDVMIHEAFCLYEQRDIYDPYAKQHSTAKDAAICANKLGVSNLFLVHSEENTAEDRERLYRQEAEKEFCGKIFVPHEMECIVFD